MATMPGANEQPKPSNQPAGQHSPGTQPATPGKREREMADQSEPIEKKHRAEDTSGQPEPSANPKRAPEHTPGYEEKMKKEHKTEAGKKDDANLRSQADDSKAKIDADDDEQAHKTQRANRAAAAKQHVRRKTPAKKPIRKHK